MLRLVCELTAKGVTVHFVKENMTFAGGKDDPRTTLMFTMLSAFFQFEHALTRERQRACKGEGTIQGQETCALLLDLVFRFRAQSARRINRTC